uniref:Major facilitator superfamily (MFS) profile domain-containing protein n=1 Tax=Chrysotila carterae TaxID=13221 RepID=A0A7S4B6D1_CHRCT
MWRRAGQRDLLRRGAGTLNSILQRGQIASGGSHCALYGNHTSQRRASPSHRALKPLHGACTPSIRHVCSSQDPQTSQSGLRGKSQLDATPESSVALQLFSTLGLTTFSPDDLRAAFDRLDATQSGVVSASALRAALRARAQTATNESKLEHEVEEMSALLMRRALESGGANELTYEQFRHSVTVMAEARDSRIWPIAMTMLVAGVAVGITTPVMPLLVRSLGLGEAQYGAVVSAFGAAKLLSNVPSAVLVDRYGRRTSMTAGLCVISLSTLALSFAGSVETLLCARAMTGVGVSALLAGATNSVADISTPLNRARMMAPMTVAFSSGTVLGPAIGGGLAGVGGIPFTFSTVAGLFFANAVSTRLLTSETKPAHQHPPRGTSATASSTATATPPADAATAKAAEDQPRGSATQASPQKHADAGGGIYSALVQTVRQWRPLLRSSEMRGVLGLNAAYWFALSGTQMTLLPLMLADADRFSLTPAQIGGLFAFQSAVSVAGAAPSAWLADKAVAVLLLWSIGGTLLGSAPTAHASNIVGMQNRAQALALMRTAGDVGLLSGASVVGAAATLIGSEAAMQTTASFLLCSAASYVLLRR